VLLVNLLTALNFERFLKIKIVWKIKNVINVKNVTKIKKNVKKRFFTSVVIAMCIIARREISGLGLSDRPDRAGARFTKYLTIILR